MKSFGQDDESLDGEFEQGENDAEEPVRGVDALEFEEATAEEHDGDLATKLAEGDEAEERIVEEVRERVEFMVKFPHVDLVDKLHQDEGVENNAAELVGVCGMSAVVDGLKIEPGRALQHQQRQHSELVEGVAEHVPPHLALDEGGAARIGLSLEQLGGRRFGGESERGEGVVDEVDPQDLDGFYGCLIPYYSTSDS